MKFLIDLKKSNLSIAQMLANLEDFNLGFDFYDKIRDRVQNMKLGEINEAAKKYYSTKNMSRVRVGRVK